MNKFIKLTKINNESIIISSRYIVLIELVDNITSVKLSDVQIQVQETLDQIFAMLDMSSCGNNKSNNSQEELKEEAPKAKEPKEKTELDDSTQDLNTKEEPEDSVGKESQPDVENFPNNDNSSKEDSESKDDLTSEQNDFLELPSNNEFSPNEANKEEEKPDPNNPYRKYTK